jgi:hypothetical protein
MTNINDIRKKYPQYGDMSDYDLAASLHKKHYSDLPFEEFSKKIDLGERPSMSQNIIGGIEAAGTIASAMLAEPIAGVMGIAQSLNPLADEGAGARAVEGTRDFITYQPKTEAGQQSLEAVGKVVEPIGKAFAASEEFLGDATFEKTGSPALSAAATAIPTAIAEALGIGLAKGGARVSRARQDANITNAIGEAAPPIDALKETSRAVFKEIDDLGASVSPQAYRRFVSELSGEMRRMGIDPDVTPSANKALNRIAQQIESEATTLTDLTTLREVAQGAASSLNRKEAMLGVRMIDSIDDFIRNLDPSSVVTRTGEAGADIGNRYRVARELWGRARKSELIQEAFEKARNQASGFENGVRAQFRSIINNKKQSRFFNKDELDAMRRVVRGDKTENIAKLIGRFGFSEGGATNIVGGALGATAGGVMGGVPGAVIVPVIGQVSRKLAQRMTAKNAEFADQVIRAGKDARKITVAYLQNTPAKQRSAAELSELLMRQDIALDTLPDNVIAIEAARIAKQRRAELAAGATAGASASASANPQRD